MKSGAAGSTLRGFLLLITLSALAVTNSGSATAQLAINEWSPPTAYSLPTLVAMDPSLNLWFTEFAGNRICRVSPSGQFQEYEIPTPNSQPWGIAVDPNGKVWFTASAGNKIGAMSPNGVFGQHDIPTAYSQPRGIALDSSGNVWFAESNGNKIGKMTPTGSFTEYNVPTPASQPWAVAVDSSGNVWFTERVGNKIGRLSPGSGQFTEFGIPTPGSSPSGVVIDPSGNVWFAEYDSNKIGVMTPSGVFTEYNIPTPNSKPMWVTLDRYGGVWYTGSNTNTFGRVYNGTVVEYSIPTPASAPFGIVVDGAGNIWFAEQAANKIAKVTGLVPTPTPTPTITPLPTYTPTPTSTPTKTPTVTPTGTSGTVNLIYLPTATPTSESFTSVAVSMQNQLVSGPGPAPRDEKFFDATGFRVDNGSVWDYFNKRGGVQTFGYPVSRTFILLGFVTQFHQRTAIQIRPDGGIQTMNVLDPDLMPYTRINGSSYPAPDRSLAEIAPKPGSPGYDVRVMQFVKEHTPDWFEGHNVNFYKTFHSAVTLQTAFPEGGGNPALLPLLNLEVWGVPISRPQRDPNNHNFIYQRFQRRIMHYDATTGTTQGLLLADYLKSIMTGSGLPIDLESQAVGSRFYRQYNSSKPAWLDRGNELSGTDLTRAFEKQ